MIDKILMTGCIVFFTTALILILAASSFNDNRSKLLERASLITGFIGIVCMLIGVLNAIWKGTLH